MWLLSLGALLVRRTHRTDRLVAALVVGAMLAGAIVFDGDSLVYLTHIWPILLLPIAPLITHGFGGQSPVGWRRPALVTALVVTAISIQTLASVRHAQSRLETRRATERVTTAATTRALWVQTHASVGCHLAGDPGLYVRYFMAFPRFTGTRATEEQIGSSYFGLADRVVEYWREKQPDVIFGDVSAALTQYIHAAAYEDAHDDVWIKRRTARQDASSGRSREGLSSTVQEEALASTRYCAPSGQRAKPGSSRRAHANGRGKMNR